MADLVVVGLFISIGGGQLVSVIERDYDLDELILINGLT